MSPLHPLAKLDATKDPKALLRLFVTCSLISMVIVLLLAGFGLKEILMREVTKNAEDDAVKVSLALLGEERDKIVEVSADGFSRVRVSQLHFAQLDRHLRVFLAPFDIIKIKIYSADTRIVYSTDAKVIGKMNADNPRLARALTGKFDSKLESKDEVVDLAEEVKFNVDVVETYIPIRDQRNKVIGSFEIYMDVTKYREQSRDTMVLFLGLLSAILLFGFLLSFPFIRKGTRDMRQVQEILRTQSITDPLTGIPNKRQIILTAHKEFSRSSRRRKKGLPDCEMGVLMLDADRFKSINDTYGHLAGDVLLKELAQRISTSLRLYDSVGRFGGEEFLVILAGADLEQSRLVAQKVWALVREEPFILEGEPVSITASIGVAASRVDDTEVDQVLKRADEALYRAKSTGRDRVVV